MANDDATSVHRAAINVTQIELMRKNVIKCWRNFWRGRGLNANTINPKIPENINCPPKKGHRIKREKENLDSD